MYLPIRWIKSSMPLPIRKISNLALPEKAKHIPNQTENGERKAESAEPTDLMEMMAVTNGNPLAMIGNHQETTGDQTTTTTEEAKAEEKAQAVTNPGETEDNQKITI